jgi:hypothetical protein
MGNVFKGAHRKKRINRRKRTGSGGGNGKGIFWDIYAVLIKRFKWTPAELNIQTPEDIFRLLDMLNSEEEEPEIPQGMEWFFGQ